jgi:hypothetical protein
LTIRASRDLYRAPAFLCILPFLTVLSTIENAPFSASLAVSLSSAERTFLTAVRIRDIAALLRSRAFKAVRILFLDDLNFGKLTLL